MQQAGPIDMLLLQEVGFKPDPLHLLPGYQVVATDQRTKDRQSSTAYLTRGPGKGYGLAVMVATSKCGWAKVEREGRFWVWVRWRSPGTPGPGIMVAVVYFPHSKSQQWQSRPAGGEVDTAATAFHELAVEIQGYHAAGASVMVMGDFNAHTKGLNDAPNSLQCEWYTPGAGLVGNVPDICARQNEDQHASDALGSLLTSMCVHSHCVILNGRTPGDQHGACTRVSNCEGDGGGERDGLGEGAKRHIGGSSSYRPTQPSTLDYGLCSIPLMSSVKQLVVLPGTRAVSDHKPLLCCVDLPDPHPPTGGESSLDDNNPAKYVEMIRWDHGKRELYVQHLESHHLPRLEQLVDGMDGASTVDSIGAVVSEFMSVVKKAATHIFGITRRVGQEGRPRVSNKGHTPNPWFKHVRAEYQAIQVAMRGGDQQSVKQSRNKFNSLKRYWKGQYAKRRHATLLADLKHDAKKFWTMFNGPSAPPVVHLLPEVSDYFEQLFGGEGRGDISEMAESPAAVVDAISAANPIQEHMFPKTGGFDNSSADYCSVMGRLNGHITEGEVMDALKGIAWGKSPGLDGIPADILKGAYKIVEDEDGNKTCINVLAAPLQKLFHAVFVSRGRYPQQWSTASITAIHKKGDPTILNNYRGIAVGSAFGKTFNTLLLHRLDRCFEAVGIRAQGQAGFRRKRCTADQVFIMRHLIDRYHHARGPSPEKLYACFVDFEKAYDSVHRTLLISRLQKVGVCGDMLYTLAGLYYEVNMAAKCTGELGQPFRTACGVQQGDPLSPLLFGLIIDEFEAWLDTRLPSTGVRMGGQLLRMLLYADDMVLLAASPSELQQQLHLLQQFCGARSLKVNTSKTEVVVFTTNRGAKTTSGHTWTIGDVRVKVSTEFKYLGVVLHSTKSMSNIAATAGYNSGMKALWGMCSRLRMANIKDIYLQNHMFATLVQPILNYCAEVWSPDMLSRIHDSESMLDFEPQKVQSQYIRHTGGLRSSTPRQLMLREFCMDPIAKGWVRAVVRYWNRVAQLADTELVKVAFVADLRQSTDNGHCWSAHIMKILHNLGLPHVTQRINDFIGGQVTQLPLIPPEDVMLKWNEVWHTVWNEPLPLPPVADDKQVKPATYLHWMSTQPLGQCRDLSMRLSNSSASDFAYVMPRYISYSASINAHCLQELIRFRCGSHKLNVETGRWHKQRKVRAERLCTKCDACEVEDEFHFIMRCSAYCGMRRKYHKLFTFMGGYTRTHMASADDMRVVMTQSNFRMLAQYITECTLVRGTLADVAVPTGGGGDELVVQEDLEIPTDYCVDTFSSDDEC